MKIWTKNENNTKLIFAIYRALSSVIQCQCFACRVHTHINCLQLFMYLSVILLSSSFTRKIGCWFSTVVYFSIWTLGENVSSGWVIISWFGIEVSQSLWFSYNLPSDWNDLPWKLYIFLVKLHSLIDTSDSSTQSIKFSQFYVISLLSEKLNFDFFIALIASRLIDKIAYA